jgi:hypothetical protein
MWKDLQQNQKMGNLVEEMGEDLQQKQKMGILAEGQRK